MKGLRFRRSVKIAPGMRVNFGLKGASLSVGTRGATMNFGKRGARATVGLPGTGLSISRTLSSSGGPSVAVAPTPVVDGAFIARMGAASSAWRAFFLLVAYGAMFVGPAGCMTANVERGVTAFSVGVLVWIVGKSFSTPAQKAVEELQLRLQELEPLANAIGEQKSLEAVHAFRAKQRDLALESGDLAGFDDVVRAQEALIRYEEKITANGGELPILEGNERAIGGDCCYYVSINVEYDKRGDNDEIGTLYLTDRKAVFVGESLAEVPWSKVVKVDRDDRTLSILRRDRKTPFLFVCGSLADAAVMDFIAARCLATAEVE